MAFYSYLTLALASLGLWGMMSVADWIPSAEALEEI